MTVASVFVALLFGGIAIWIGIRLIKVMRKPASQPQDLAPPLDPWGEGRTHRRARHDPK